MILEFVDIQKSMNLNFLEDYDFGISRDIKIRFKSKRQKEEFEKNLIKNRDNNKKMDLIIINSTLYSHFYYYPTSPLTAKAHLDGLED